MGILPLQGIRIADFTWLGVGPACTFLLATLGAECIRIINAARPIETRRLGGWPARVKAHTLDVHLFNDLQVNKICVAIDASKPEGLELIKNLIAISNVVAENFSPGTMKKLGLSYEELCQIKPDIIMVSLSASGQTGPENFYRGYAPVFAALGGLSSITGYKDGPPTELRHSMDYFCGFAGAFAALAAIFHWQQTGEGQYVDVANRETLSCTIGEMILDYTMNGRIQGPQGNIQPTLAPHNVYPCMGDDRWVTIAVGSPKEWEALCFAINHPDWLQDPKFADQYLRWKHQAEIDKLISNYTRAHDPYEVTELLQKVGVAAFPSMNNEDLFTDRHLQNREVYEVPVHPEEGAQAMPGAPWKMSQTPTPIQGANPNIGEHNEYVLCELLGISKEKYKQLEQTEVIYVERVGKTDRG
jgi:crotonobetainyl-CoA:carnitine CoA-transferase CaiB-like acyl-CoA transferase